MNDTLFLHIETNLSDEDGFPIAISWSLTDTRIKSVLIVPEDEWLEEAYETDTALNTDLQTLYNQGASCWDIIRELELDMDGRSVFVTNQNAHEKLLNMIHEAAGRELPFEIVDITELFNAEEEQIHTQLQQIAAENGLNIVNGQDHIMALLLLARDYQLI